MTTPSISHVIGRLRAAACLFAPLLVMLSLQSCGSDSTFRINGKIDNFGTGNLRVVYYADGAVQSVVAPAIDGKFSMTGRLNRPAVGRVYTGNGIPVGRFAVRPGETIEAEFDISDPTKMKFSGNDDSQRLAEFAGQNAALINGGDTEALNSVIARYVTDNSKRLVSGILMADYFDMRGHEAQARELIDKLSDEVVAAASLHGLTDLTRRLTVPTDSLHLEPFRLFSDKDSATEINPQARALTLLLFTDNSNRRSDAVTGLVTAMEPLGKKGSLQMVEISCDPDTAAWKTSVKKSATDADTLRTSPWSRVQRCWTPAPYNIMGLEEIPVASLPWFVVADSTRRVLYRGPSADDARKSIIRK